MLYSIVLHFGAIDLVLQYTAVYTMLVGGRGHLRGPRSHVSAHAVLLATVRLIISGGLFC